MMSLMLSDVWWWVSVDSHLIALWVRCQNSLYKSAMQNFARQVCHSGQFLDCHSSRFWHLPNCFNLPRVHSRLVLIFTLSGFTFTFLSQNCFQKKKRKTFHFVASVSVSSFLTIMLGIFFGCWSSLNRETSFIQYFSVWARFIAVKSNGDTSFGPWSSVQTPLLLCSFLLHSLNWVLLQNCCHQSCCKRSFLLSKIAQSSF